MAMISEVCEGFYMLRRGKTRYKDPFVFKVIWKDDKSCYVSGLKNLVMAPKGLVGKKIKFIVEVVE